MKFSECIWPWWSSMFALLFSAASMWLSYGVGVDAAGVLGAVDPWMLGGFLAICAPIAISRRMMGKKDWIVFALIAGISTAIGAHTRLNATATNAEIAETQETLLRAQAVLSSSAAQEQAAQIASLPADIERARGRVADLALIVTPLREQVATYRAQLTCEATAQPEGCLGLNNKPVTVASEGPNWAALNCRLNGLNCREEVSSLPLSEQLGRAEAELSEAERALSDLRALASTERQNAGDTAAQVEQSIAALEASRQNAIGLGFVDAWAAFTLGMWRPEYGPIIALAFAFVTDILGPMMWAGFPLPSIRLPRPKRPPLFVRFLYARDPERRAQKRIALAAWDQKRRDYEIAQVIKSIYRTGVGITRDKCEAAMDVLGLEFPDRLSESAKNSFTAVQSAKSNAPVKPKTDLGSLAGVMDGWKAAGVPLETSTPIPPDVSPQQPRNGVDGEARGEQLEFDETSATDGRPKLLPAPARAIGE